MSASYDTDRVWTLPNVLSMMRLVGVPVFFWLVVWGHLRWTQADLLAVGLLCVAGATDWLDGFLARRWKQTSRLGQMLDPVADRLYILAIVLALALRDIVPWWLLVALAARDLMLAALVPVLRTRGYTSLPVHVVGKAATFCLLYAFPLVLVGAGAEAGWRLVCRVAGWAFAGWGTGLYWWAGLLYLVQTARLARELPPSGPAGAVGDTA